MVKRSRRTITDLPARAFRNILTAALAGALSSAACARRGAAVAANRPPMPKVVYHLSDLDKVSFALGNIRNHFDGIWAAPTRSRLRWSHRVGEFGKAALELNACGNTMKAQKLALEDLLPGFVVAERGGVVRIAELQSMPVCGRS
jgi:uncharacterized protein